MNFLHIIGFVIIAIGALLLASAYTAKSRLKKISGQKSQLVNELQPGSTAEVQGTVVAGQPLHTPFSQQPCVYYDYVIEREEMVRDQQGQERRQWVSAGQHNERTPFYLQDATGRIAVYPDQMEIDPQPMGERFLNESEFISNPILKAIVGLASVPASTRVTERAILVGGPAYVFGAVSQRQGGLAIQRADGASFLTYKTEEQVESGLQRTGKMNKVLGFVFVAIGIALVIVRYATK